MIDPNLRELRDLKELYIQFNTRNSGKPMDARIELDELINHYLHCGNSIFVDFANLLIRSANSGQTVRPFRNKRCSYSDVTVHLF